ncbi:ATP synthase I subunit [Breznakia blatticola]|uniref:ATP synthase I subunit n=1 Tax=Breznakia blatticola TaxID=1754012 RepID=A0A4R7ZXX6_9FIRM|nr:ATP synthase subunit I [Breznakia blatticola]TDW20550.1 ATP synthase I subunit [Breznakia blatticola]
MRNKQFSQIELLAVGIALISAAIIYLITRNTQDIFSVLYGALIAIAGFHGIVISSKSLIDNPNKAKNLAIMQYAFRYIIYLVLLVVGYIFLHLELVGMLVGFVSLSFAIKIHAILTHGKEV